MPTYDYICKKCGHHFEAFQKMNDLPLSNCPKCKGKAERVISGGVGMIFKGSGFYITDYKNQKKPADKKEKPVKKEEKSKDSDKNAA